jgi:hypothetical protein
VESLKRIDIFRHAVPGTCLRLEGVREFAEDRIATLAVEREGVPLLVLPGWKQKPAFELHIVDGLADTLAHLDCLMMFQHIVMAAERAHIVVLLHEPMAVVVAALEKRSPRLAEKLGEGRVLRHVSGAPTGETGATGENGLVPGHPPVSDGSDPAPGVSAPGDATLPPDRGR